MPTVQQVIVPAASRSVISATPKTTLQIGTYTALTDTFTSVVDLNDRATFWLDTLDLGQPQKADSRTFTLRAPGERVVTWQYKNRHIKASVHLLYRNGTAAVQAAIRALLQAAETPPYRLAIAPPNHTVLTYADVVRVTHTIPYDAKQILTGALTKISIDFECLPGLAGDRITLQNLVVNPGMEAPGLANDFVDLFNNLLTYTTVSGAAPTLTSNNLQAASGTVVTFGSPAWGAFYQWACRFNLTNTTGATAQFYLHYTTANDWIRFDCNATSYAFYHNIAGTVHTLANGSCTLSASSYYWFVVTQFPAASGNTSTLSAGIYNDSTGTVGTLNTGVSAVQSTTTASTIGVMALGANGGTVNFGGYAGKATNIVALYGPGAWQGESNNGSTSTALCAPAWEQNPANCYQGGPVASNACARLDLAPLGPINTAWETYAGGGTAGTAGIIAGTVGDVVGMSAWARTTSGIAATTSIGLAAHEWDSNGAYLRSTTLQSFTGAQTAWTKLSGSFTVGASTAWLSLQLFVIDNTSGAYGSANGTVWFDNAQCWDQTTTGQSVMPYCELRFQQSPAQLMVGSTQGDMVAPAFLALGTYRSLANGKTLSAVLGRLLTPNPAAVLVGQALFDNSQPPNILTACVSDANSYGGWYWQVTCNQASGQSLNTQTQWISAPASSFAGAFHLYERFWCSQANYASLSAQAWVPITASQWETGPVVSRRALYKGTILYPLNQQNNWIDVDAGLVTLPMYGQAALQDNTKSGYITPQVDWTDPSDTLNGTYRHNWHALVPIDGGLLSVRVANGTTTSGGNYWWCYADGLAIQQGGDPTWHYSLEPKPVINPAAGVGGIGVGVGNGTVAINPSAESYLQIDPTQTVANGATSWRGINQYVGFITSDATSGEVLPLFTEVIYTPLYLTPRDQ